MIHGKNRATVLTQLEQLNSACGLAGFEQEILFSRRCFKQRGAIYQRSTPTDVGVTLLAQQSGVAHIIGNGVRI